MNNQDILNLIMQYKNSEDDSAEQDYICGQLSYDIIGSIKKGEQLVLNGGLEYSNIIAHMMDEELIEKVELSHKDVKYKGDIYADQAFLDKYIILHEEKFDETFDSKGW